MEDITLVNNATLCMNVTRHNAAMWRGTVQKELLCHLAITKNTTQQLHNAKLCTLEHCVSSHILRQVLYIRDPYKTTNVSTLAVSVFYSTSMTEASKWNLLLQSLFSHIFAMVSGCKCFHASGPTGSASGPFF